MIRTTLTGLAALLLTSSIASAQMGQEEREKMRKKMAEISELMRESERLLLEITRVDRLVTRQNEIVRKLKELEPPDTNDAAATAAHQEKVKELRKQQKEAAEKLGNLFDNQRQRGQTTVLQLEQLLKNWPKKQQQGQGKPDNRTKRQKDEEKRLREKQQEQKQHSQKQQNQKSRDKPNGMKRPKDEKQTARARRSVEAWIAKLPEKQQERISRGDLSDIPPRYRRLVREYTALRAKREAERAKEEDR